MRYFIPSWNGDLRLESNPKKLSETLLTIVSPTEGEKKVLDEICAEAVKQGWVEKSVRTERGGFFWRKKRAVLAASVEVVGPIVAKIMRPGPAVLTAIHFSDGKVVTTDGGVKEIKEAIKPKAKAEPEVAATVKRHTPCCPQCVPGAIGPASEVLLSFLNEEEHSSWAKRRQIVVEGGLSGHRYLLAHRHSETAGKIGRICYDLDDETVVHFHDVTVPPEEEVLAAKLILEHREPWLRNEATLWDADMDVQSFKNPFGDGGDGVADATFTQAFGKALRKSLQ